MSITFMDMTDGESLLQKIFYVGCLYTPMTDVNPVEILGFGTWKKIEGKFLLAASDEYEAESMGGSAEHTLTKEEMPSHIHEVRNQYIQSSLGEIAKEKAGFVLKEDAISFKNAGEIYNGSKDSAYFGNTGYSGGEGAASITEGTTKAHNNMPPYLALYVYRRLA